MDCDDFARLPRDLRLSSIRAAFSRGSWHFQLEQRDAQRNSRQHQGWQWHGISVHEIMARRPTQCQSFAALVRSSSRQTSSANTNWMKHQFRRSMLLVLGLRDENQIVRTNRMTKSKAGETAATLYLLTTTIRATTAERQLQEIKGSQIVLSRAEKKE